MRIIALFLLAAAGVFGQTLPDWYIPLRDSIYEQKLSANEIVPLYQNTSATARNSLSGERLYVMLSRCEYMMGRAYQFEERNAQAVEHYTHGLSWAEEAKKIRESSEAWQMMAENISQLCAIRGVAFAIANGLKVEEYSKKALNYNSRNAAAQYMIAARWVFAPAPLNNYRRGIDMMSAILTNGDMDRDDRFNVNLAIGYVYIQQKKYSDARVWLERALEIFPTNKYARELLSTASR